MATVITMPTESPLYAFSPSKIDITTTNANQKVTFLVNSTYTFVRYSGSDKKLIMPLSKILKSAWATTDIGDVILATSGNTNSSSKLVKSIVLRITPDTESYTDYTVSTIWGAKQLSITEPITETIYRFGALPLTVTQTKGNMLASNTASIGNFLGRDHFVSNNPNVTYYQIKQDTTVLKAFNVVDLPYCANDIYLRWVDTYGQYKYFNFLLGESMNETKGGDMFKKELLSLAASENGLYKSQNQLIDIQGSPVQGLSVPTATYDQQKHLQGLETSVKCWKYLGSNQWVEVLAKVEPIKIDERWKQNQSVNLTITLPDLYLQSL